MTNEQEIPPLNCGDLCGATVRDEKDALHAAWSFMHILRRWRCPKCHRELEAAAHINGTSLAERPDTLPNDSIGALRRSTAHEILPPSVKP